MSQKEAVHIASRALAILCLVNAFYEAMFLPERLLSLLHYINVRSVLVTNDYLSTYYEVAAGLLLARVAVFLIVAVVFWKCGPMIQALLSRSSAK